MHLCGKVDQLSPPQTQQLHLLIAQLLTPMPLKGTALVPQRLLEWVWGAGHLAALQRARPGKYLLVLCMAG